MAASAGRPPSDERYLICNADEGDPGAFMNRSLIEGDPHAVLEGMLIAAYAIGASHGYIYIRAEYPLAIERLKRRHRRDARGRPARARTSWAASFCFDIKIKEGAGAFVCGEETALIATHRGAAGHAAHAAALPGRRPASGASRRSSTTWRPWAPCPTSCGTARTWYAGFGTESSQGHQDLHAWSARCAAPA